jgi:HK97 gp10 family phage protein
MASGVYHVFNTAEVNRLLSSRSGGVARDALRRGYRVEAEMKRRCPVDHGRLRGSLHTQLVSGHRSGVPFHVEVGTDVKYAIYVEKGTGLYGPKHARIYPQRGKVMVFTPRKGASGGLIPRGARNVVFARSTRGMKAQPFMGVSLHAAFR